MKRCAVIDIGTLKVKVLIASMLSGGSINNLYSSNTLTCFGVDMDKNGGLVLDKYLNDTIEELKRCNKILEKYRVDKYKVVSTHAMRRAKNKNDIIKKILQKTGFEVEKISQQKEAELFFNAVVSGLKKGQEYAVLDVGGGSVQILIGSSDKLYKVHLMQTGAQYLHDNFTRDSGSENSFTTEHELKNMKSYILEQLPPFPKKENIPVVYGSSNVIDLMKEINIPLIKREDSKMHPYKTHTRHLNQFIKKMLPLSHKEREDLYNFQRGYMWGVDKAFLNVITIAEHLNSPYIIPTNANVAQGLIYEML